MLLLVPRKYLYIIEVFDRTFVATFYYQLFQERVRKIGRMSSGGSRNQNWGGQGLGGVEDRGDVAIERKRLSPSIVGINGYSKRK